MKRQRIRLTESDLHRIIEQSLNDVLNEGMEEGLGSFFRGAFGDDAEKVKGAFNKAGNFMKNKAVNLGRGIKQGGQNFYQGMQNRYNKGVETSRAQNQMDTARKSEAKSNQNAQKLYDTLQACINDGTLHGQRTIEYANILMNLLKNSMRLNRGNTTRTYNRLSRNYNVRQ